MQAVAFQFACKERLRAFIIFQFPTWLSVSGWHLLNKIIIYYKINKGNKLWFWENLLDQWNEWNQSKHMLQF